MIFLTVKRKSGHGDQLRIEPVDTAVIGDDKSSSIERDDEPSLRHSKAQVFKWLQENEYEVNSIRNITCEFDPDSGHHVAVVDVTGKAKKKA